MRLSHIIVRCLVPAFVLVTGMLQVGCASSTIGWTDITAGARNLFTPEVRRASLDLASDESNPVHARIMGDSSLLHPGAADGFLFKASYDISANATAAEEKAASMSPTDPQVVELHRQAATLRQQAKDKEIELTTAMLEKTVEELVAAERNQAEASKYGPTVRLDQQVSDLRAWRQFLQDHLAKFKN